MTESKLRGWGRAQGDTELTGKAPTTGISDRSQLTHMGMFSLAEDSGKQEAETGASARAATALSPAAMPLPKTHT